MARYGWGRGESPVWGGAGRPQGGPTRPYGRDFYGGRYGRETDYGRGNSYGRGNRYGKEFGRPPPDESARAYHFVDAPRRYAMDQDEILRSAVRQKLFEDTWLDARNVQVEAEDGVIYLSGTVTSHLESRYAWDDAWETDGVHGVVSRIEIEGAGAGGDEGD